MKLIVLGSGTAVPSVERSAAAYYLQIENREVLIDCGSGAMVQLTRAKMSYKTIDAAFITHTHYDHIGDLARLIQAIKATPGFNREKELRLFGPPGFIDFFQSTIDQLVPRPKSFDIRLAEVQGAFDFFCARIKTLPVRHSRRMESAAYRFEHRGKSIVFSGDLDYCDEIITLSKDADLLVLDCGSPSDVKRAGHLMATECGEIAKLAGVKRLLLTHLPPTESAADSRLDECRAVFDGEVALAEDLMVIEI